MERIIITEETAKQFIENLKNKVEMVCFCFYDFPYGDGLVKRKVDIAKTNYCNNSGWHISCRGVIYLDSIDWEELTSDERGKLIINEVYSFIVL